MTSRRSLPSLGERVFVVAAVLLLSGGFLDLLTPDDPGDKSSGAIFMQILWALVYSGVLFLLFKHCKGFARELLRHPWIIALFAWAMISAVWSGVPGLTLRRGIALMGTCLFGFYLTLRYDLKTQLKLVAWSLALAALFSLLFGLLGLGSCGAMAGADGGGWCGIFVQKNRLGTAMVLAILIFLLLSKLSDAHKWFLRACAAGAFLLLLLSDSKTSLIASLALFVVLPYGRLFRGSMARAVTAAGVAVSFVLGGAYWALHHIGGITEALGRNITLTGRIPLWILSVVMALRKPWLGYGYNAFWLGYAGPSAPIWKVVGWRPFYAHNGILELWLDLGLVGVALFAVGFMFYLIRSIGYMRKNSGPEAFWPFLFLVFMVLTNLTESSLLASNNISWMLYVSVAVLVSRPTLRNLSASPRSGK